MTITSKAKEFIHATLLRFVNLLRINYHVDLIITSNKTILFTRYHNVYYCECEEAVNFIYITLLHLHKFIIYNKSLHQLCWKTHLILFAVMIICD